MSPPGDVLFVVVVDDSEVFAAVSGAGAPGSPAAAVSPAGAGTTVVSLVVSLHPTVAVPTRNIKPIKAAALLFLVFMEGEMSTLCAAVCSRAWLAQ